mmetsp:Transcript_3150/g.10914  ORF Transcript_3150/g.10914 Transcript_3150/m.10914 type:complete len:345 (-) Transcript_3150:181-1215(-)
MLGRLGSPLGGGKGNEVHVVSYNVLSSSLASPGYFQHCRPENLHAEKRYKKLTLKLEEQVKRSAVICLQEVSTAWAGQLHSFFQKEDYYLISSHYTKQWQGYMGSAIAFPTTRFTAEEVEVVRVADTKSWPKRPKPTMFGKLSTAVQDLFFGPKRNEDHYDLARNRQNTMVLCKLKCRTSGKKICVGTYHMPCMFWAPKVMVIHSALVCQKIQSFSKGEDTVLCGDFNFKPTDSMYELCTRGSISEDDENYPEPTHPEETWTPELEYGFDSAYKTVNGEEPDFTNYAKIRDDPTFIETLDYVFYSPSLKAKDVVAVPHRDDVEGPLPNKEEPSDHIMVGATFEL